MRDMYVIVFRRKEDGIECCDDKTDVYTSKKHAKEMATIEFHRYLRMLDSAHIKYRKHDSLPFHVVINDDIIAGYVLGKIEMCK